MASKPLTELRPHVTPVSSEVPADLIPPLASAPAIGDEGQEIVPYQNSVASLEGQKALPRFDALRGPDSPAIGWVPFRAPDETATAALPPVLCRQLSPYFVGEYLGWKLTHLAKYSHELALKEYKYTLLFNGDTGKQAIVNMKGDHDPFVWEQVVTVLDNCGYLCPFDWCGLSLDDRRALILGLHHHGVTQEILEDLYEYAIFCRDYFLNSYAKSDTCGDAFVIYNNLSGVNERATWPNSPADDEGKIDRKYLKPEWDWRVHQDLFTAFQSCVWDVWDAHVDPDRAVGVKEKEEILIDWCVSKRRRTKKKWEFLGERFYFTGAEGGSTGPTDAALLGQVGQLRQLLARPYDRHYPYQRLVLSIKVRERVEGPFIDTEVNGLGLEDPYPVKQWKNTHLGKWKTLPTIFKFLHLSKEQLESLNLEGVHLRHWPLPGKPPARGYLVKAVEMTLDMVLQGELGLNAKRAYFEVHWTLHWSLQKTIKKTASRSKL